MELNDVKEQLAAPIPCKWKPEITTKKGPNNTRVNIERNGQRVAGCTAHIDARDVMDVLDAVVGPGNWSDSYQPAAIGLGVECTLTVLGVSKADVGMPSSQDAEKGAYSDAFKRAAVKFGIGRFLYGMEIQDRKMFYLLKAKCSLMERIFKVKIGNLIFKMKTNSF